MQFKINTGPFRSALNKVLTVVDKKSTNPILTYTLIRAKDQFIELIATDLDISVKIILSANVEKNGVFCVNPKNLFEIVKELPDLEVSLNLEASILSLNCQDIHYSLVVSSSDEFPLLSFEKRSNEFELDSCVVYETLNRTSYAISTDETRPFLNGLFLQMQESKLRSVATDGHRLALFEVPFNDKQNTSLINGILVPKKGVYELKKLSEAYPNEKIKISIDESFLFISANNSYYLSIRLIGRDYPKYQAVIPNKITYSMTVDKEAFLDAVKRIKIMSNEKSHGVRVSLSKNEMVIAANHPSLGHAKEKLPISYDNKEFEIGFNAVYLIELFSNLPSGETTFEFNNEFSPVIVRSASLPDFLGIIMPLKL